MGGGRRCASGQVVHALACASRILVSLCASCILVSLDVSKIYPDEHYYIPRSNYPVCLEDMAPHSAYFQAACLTHRRQRKVDFDESALLRMQGCTVTLQEIAASFASLKAGEAEASLWMFL